MVAERQSVRRKNNFILVQRTDTTIRAWQKIPQFMTARVSVAAFFSGVAAHRRETASRRLRMAPHSLQERFQFEQGSLGGGGYR